MSFRMKPAYRKNNELLADIANARANGRPRLWWLGQSGFLIVTPAATVLFDPYLSDSLTTKYAATDKPHTRVTERVIDPGLLTGIDLITSSHNHTDHLDAETLRPLLAANPEAKLVIPRANRGFVLERLGAMADRLLEIDGGERLTHGGITIHGIPAAHNTVERDENGHCRFLGYIAGFGGFTFYHSGDTLMHDGLVPALAPFAPDIAFVPINGNKPERRVAGNLDGREAAELAGSIHARLAIPHHFDMFEFNTATPEQFSEACRSAGQPFRVLGNGEGFDLPSLP
jgi:L-ascorbate metabolism protein UlaG (beta-lactamase superfamily)